MKKHVFKFNNDVQQWHISNTTRNKISSLKNDSLIPHAIIK